MAKKFEASVCFQVFARVYVEAVNETEARKRIAKGGSFLESSNIDFEKHTAEMVAIESIQESE